MCGHGGGNDMKVVSQRGGGGRENVGVVSVVVGMVVVEVLLVWK